jgi:hypothetical protein
MLYLANYEVALDQLENAMAKRLEWEEAAPEGFRVVCEYAVHGQPPPFGGVLVFETDDVEHITALVLFFGKTVTFDIRPASDVKQTIESVRRSLGQAAAR